MSYLIRALLFASLLLSAGCMSLEPLLASLTPPATTAPTRQATSTPPLPTETAPAESNVSSLRVWLPAQFNPAVENAAAEMLAERLSEFGSEHNNLDIEIRIKKADSDDDVLNALAVTSAAAPGALPDLILLSRPELEAAAVQGLLHPMDGLSTTLDDPNWYDYAQQLGHIQNTGYGLPFIGDVLVMVYYPELGEIVSWEDVLGSEGHLVFPAGNPQGVVALSLYASAGGEILDPGGLPMLDPDILTRVLTLVDDGISKEVFPPSLANVTNEMQTLQIYRSGSANKGIVSFLSYRPAEDGSVTPLPGLEDVPFSYATGWVWALAGSNPENQQLAVELAEFLVADEFLAEWTRETGYLPTRPSLVEEGDRATTAILESAHPIPSTDVLGVLGPLMQEALTRVLNGEAPEDVSASIVGMLR